jgi:hypothetical protein
MLRMEAQLPTRMVSTFYVPLSIILIIPIVWPFPTNRDDLLVYLEQGLSLRYLFPSTSDGAKIRCNAELKLVGAHCENWGRIERCTHESGTLESYQRHVKQHLGMKRSKTVALDKVVKKGTLQDPFPSRFPSNRSLCSVEMCGQEDPATTKDVDTRSALGP